MISNIFNVANIVFYCLLGLSILLLSSKIFLHLYGCAKAKEFPEAKKEHKFAFIIPARNESKVIGQLLTDIQNQDYNHDKIDTYVIVESENDPTCQICANFKHTHVFVRQHLELKGKGYALDECFTYILNQNRKEEDKYEAFVIMDADNVICKDFIKEMNKCYDAGYDVACGYRDNKNWNDSWVSACSGLVFTVFSSFKNKPKAKLGLGVQVTGTGFYVSSKIIEQLDGWKFKTLTEDFEFTLASVLNNYNSTYNEKAKFYDEQPTKLKVSWKQRVRWCKGFMQAGKIYNKQLLKSGFKNEKKKAYDLFENATSVVPLVVSIVTVLLYGIFNLVLFIVALALKDPIWYLPFVAFLGVILGFYLLMVLYTAFLFIVERKRVNIKFSKALVACLTNPIFMMLYIPIFLQAVFSKNVEWTPIAHTTVVTEEQIING